MDRLVIQADRQVGEVALSEMGDMCVSQYSPRNIKLDIVIMQAIISSPVLYNFRDCISFLLVISACCDVFCVILACLK